jgi:hypothetical protein
VFFWLLVLKTPMFEGGTSDRDSKISFSADGHVYTVTPQGFPEMVSKPLGLLSQYQNALCSASTLVAGLVDRFDAKTHAVRLCGLDQNFWTAAKYTKLKDEYLRSVPAAAAACQKTAACWLVQHWRDSGRAAAAAGTELHAVIERVLNAEIHLLERSDHKIPELVEVQYADFRTRYKNLRPYKTEWRVFDETTRVCGTIDALFEDEQTGHFWLVDWKRTKKDLSPGAHSYDKTLRVLGLPDNPHNRYRVQLSVYAHILEKYDIKVKNQDPKKKTLEKILLVALWPGTKPVVTEVVPIPFCDLRRALEFVQNGHKKTKRYWESGNRLLQPIARLLSNRLQQTTQQGKKRKPQKRLRI